MPYYPAVKKTLGMLTNNMVLCTVAIQQFDFHGVQFELIQQNLSQLFKNCSKLMITISSFWNLKHLYWKCVLQLFTLNKHTFLKFLANQFVENLSIILLVNYVMHHVLVVHGRDQKGVRVAHEIPCNITQKPASIFLDDNGTMPNFDFGGSVWWVPFIMEIVCIFVVATLITVFKQFLKLTMKCNGYF